MEVESTLRKPFASRESFTVAANTCYQLTPFRFTRVPGTDGMVLVVNELGEYHFLSEEGFHRFRRHSLRPNEDVYLDLRSKHFLLDEHCETYWPYAVSQYRTRKSFLQGGPALHIVVVTLRCDHTCRYCQVSRQLESASCFDLSERDALLVIDRIFESPSSHLKVEFQGGEPFLAFDRIRFMVEKIEERNATEGRTIEFVIATTLHHLTDDRLEFCRSHRISLSTSLDGPADLHNRNRPRRGSDSYERTIAGIGHARAALGTDAVSALVTLTRESLKHPEQIVDTYLGLEFPTIFLRPLSPYGFAARSAFRIGYSVDDFLAFYDRALDRIVQVNRGGTYLEETYTSILLQHILTPHPTGYVDLCSPAGAMFGALVYNYDGGVYASDEGRMLAETGDQTFRLGHVTESYAALLASPAARELLGSNVAEALAGCSDCAFLPYCGADPVHHRAVHGRQEGHRPTSDFCRRQTALFQRIFRRLACPQDASLRVMMSWLTRGREAFAAQGN
jgi:His-Xaa-Ser system radical SAM maturase HxsB